MKLLLFFLCLALGAQELLEVPPLAYLRDWEGRLSPIYGLAGNFVHGPAGAEVLAYSNDGDIEWRLEPGRLVAQRDAREAFYPTEATAAEFRGDTALLRETGELLRLEGETLVAASAAAQPSTVAGRVVTWSEGRLTVRQADGAETVVDCPGEPSEITAAAANWARLTVGRQTYLLRLDAGRVELFVLPARRRL